MEGQTADTFNAVSFSDFAHSCFVIPGVLCCEPGKQ
jgi:hypothetical protein